MPTGGPDDEDDNNRVSDLSPQEAWALAQNFSPGDTIIVNGDVEMEIVDVKQNETSIECLVNLQSKEGPWRVLRIDMTHYHSVKISTPEDEQRIIVDDIAPAAENILSEATASELLPGDVTGQNTVDPYIEQRDPGVEFSEDVSVEGECPCGGDIGRLDWRVVCESCGRWVPVEIWDFWMVDNSDDSQDNPSTDSETDGENSGNRSLGDFM